MASVDEYVDCSTRLLLNPTFASAVAEKLGPDNLRHAQIFDSGQTHQAFGDALVHIHRRSPVADSAKGYQG